MLLRIRQLDPRLCRGDGAMTEFGNIKPGMQRGWRDRSRRKLAAEVVVVDGMGDAASGTFGMRLAAQSDYAIPAGVKCQVRLENPAGCIGAGKG